MPALSLQARDNDSNQSQDILYTGLAIIGAIVAAVVVWLTVRWLGRRARNAAAPDPNTAERDVEREYDPYLNVQGLVPINEKVQSAPVIAPQVQPQFSRQQLTQSIILPERPERVLTKVRDHRQEIIDYHRQSGNFPRPFSFALSQTGVPRPRRTSASSPARSSMLNPNANRASHSSYSSIAASSHYSVISSVSSYTFGSTNGTQKRVRQIFEPVLPDELVVRLDEKVTLVQSFDDGWCVVGRDVPLFAGATKSLYKSPEPVDANIELGVVPAWCFMRPVKGLRAERPVRSSSLGITVQMDNPAFSSRNEIMSWSNF